MLHTPTGNGVINQYFVFNFFYIKIKNCAEVLWWYINISWHGGTDNFYQKRLHICKYFIPFILIAINL